MIEDVKSGHKSNSEMVMYYMGLRKQASDWKGFIARKKLCSLQGWTERIKNNNKKQTKKKKSSRSDTNELHYFRAWECYLFNFKKQDIHSFQYLRNKDKKTVNKH